MNEAHRAVKARARVERLQRRARAIGNIREDKRSPEAVERLGRVRTRLKQLQAA